MKLPNVPNWVKELAVREYELYLARPTNLLRNLGIEQLSVPRWAKYWTLNKGVVEVWERDPTYDPYNVTFRNNGGRRKEVMKLNSAKLPYNYDNKGELI